MTKEEMLKCLENIDDKFIEEAALYYRKDRRIMKVAVLVAGIVLVIGISGIYVNYNYQKRTNVAKNTVEHITTNIKDNSSIGAQFTTPFDFNNVKEMEFAYNNTTYTVVEDESFLLSNSIPVDVGQNLAGACLKNNVGDISNNMVLGDIYKYNGSEDLSVLILKTLDGAYKVAVDNSIYK